MKAEELGSLATGCHRRNAGHYFNRMGGARLLGQKSQMQENAPSTITPDRLSNCGINAREPRVLPARVGELRLANPGKDRYPGVTIPRDTLPGLNSIGFWDGAAPQDWGLGAHRDKCLTLHFVEAGNIAFMADERRFNLRAGDFAVTRPWQLHQLGDPHIGPGRVHWLVIDVGIRNPNDQWHWPGWVTLTPKDLLELTQKFRRNKMPVGKSTPEIARIFRQLATCVVQWKQPHSASRTIANLNQLFVSLLDMPAAPGPGESPDRDSGRRTVEVFLKGLEENLINDEEIATLRQMAEHCGMGITSFAKYTRELVNVGPMEFLKRCRLIRAARQLREQPGVSITDVCFSHGFNSSQYFATCFRKQFKMSPSEFVSRQR